MKSLIIIILDESESMEMKMSDVINGFNRFISDQKKIDCDSSRFYLVKFSSFVTVVHKGIPLELVPQLSFINYSPNGSTALYDAIAHSVELADKEKTEEERVICVIITDGEENCSKNTNLDEIKTLITGHEAQGDWTFLYIGENPVEWAKKTGMKVDQGIHYNHNQPLETMGRLNFAVTNFRSTESSHGEDLFSEEVYSSNSYNSYVQK